MIAETIVPPRKITPNSAAYRVTADEFWMMDFGVQRSELIDGKVFLMAPVGEEHGVLTSDLSVELGYYVKNHNLGRTLAAETGFRINDFNVRAADIAFISWARWREQGEKPSAKFSTRVPDLIVEFVSPDDRPREIKQKVREWFAYGVRLLWVAYPKSRTIHVYQSPTDVKILSDADELDGGDVVPGFVCAVSKIFA